MPSFSVLFDCVVERSNRSCRIYINYLFKETRNLFQLKADRHRIICNRVLPHGFILRRDTSHKGGGSIFNLLIELGAHCYSCTSAIWETTWKACVLCWGRGLYVDVHGFHLGDWFRAETEWSGVSASILNLSEVVGAIFLDKFDPIPAFSCSNHIINELRIQIFDVLVCWKKFVVSTVRSGLHRHLVIFYVLLLNSLVITWERER